MATFIIGLIGYGLGLAGGLSFIMNFAWFGTAEEKSREERAFGKKAINSLVFAIVVTLATHWFIKLAL